MSFTSKKTKIAQTDDPNHLSMDPPLLHGHIVATRIRIFLAFRCGPLIFKFTPHKSRPISDEAGIHHILLIDLKETCSRHISIICPWQLFLSLQNTKAIHSSPLKSTITGPKERNTYLLTCFLACPKHFEAVFCSRAFPLWLL